MNKNVIRLWQKEDKQMKIISRKYEEIIDIRKFINELNEETITYILQEYDEEREIDNDYMFDRFVKITQELRNKYKNMTDVLQESYKRLLIDEQVTEKEIQEYEEGMTKEWTIMKIISQKMNKLLTNS